MAVSISVGITAQCQRTKNWSLGVNTPLSKTSNGVSSSGGRVRCRIIAPFCGNAVVIGRCAGAAGQRKLRHGFRPAGFCEGDVRQRNGADAGRAEQSPPGKRVVKWTDPSHLRLLMLS